MDAYTLKVENLPQDSTDKKIREFFNSPSAVDVLRSVEIVRLSSTETATAILTTNSPGSANRLLQMQRPNFGGNQLNIKPELFEEMSLTLSRAWLKEAEDQHPKIQAEIRELSKQLGIRVETESSTRKTTLRGLPVKVKELQAVLEEKLGRIVCNRSSDGHKRMCASLVEPGACCTCDDTKSADLSSDFATRQPGYDQELKGHQPKPSGRKLKEGSTSGNDSMNEQKKGLGQSNKAGGLAQAATSDDSVDDIKQGQRERDAAAENSQKGTTNNRLRQLKVTGGEGPQFHHQSEDLNKASRDAYPVSTDHHHHHMMVTKGFHRYLLEHSQACLLDFSDCSVSHEKVDAFLWTLRGSNKKDLEYTISRLNQVQSGVLELRYDVPDEIEFAVFETFIKENNENKDVTFVFRSDKSNCTIVGPKNAVEATYNWMAQTVTGNIKTGGRKLKTSSVSDIDDVKKQRGGGQGPSDQKPRTGDFSFSKPKPEDVVGIKNPTKQISNRNASKPLPGEYRSAFHIIKRQYKDVLELETLGSIRVHVYQGDMIKQPTQVIVNPANKFLCHAGGLAKVIANACGPGFQRESREIIDKKDQLETGEVVHTSAGELRLPIEYVIHAVGPTVHDFKDNEEGLISILTETFYNCLDYANHKLEASSISIPPISAGIFAVPLPYIMEAAVEAIWKFDRINAPTARKLAAVHLISNDAKTTEEMIEMLLGLIG